MPRSTERGAMLGCFPSDGRRPKSPPLAAVYEEGSTSAASTSVGTGSPLSSASTSSPAFLDELAPLYPDDSEAEADASVLSTAIASRRFFLASPGRSNSIVDSSEHAASSHGGRSVHPNAARSSGRAGAGATPAAIASATKALRAREEDDDAVRRISVSTDAPRAEFLKSMVEMADALELDSRRGPDRARLHDLLLCYIAINDRDSLRDILGAFTDLLCLLNANNASNSTSSTTTDGDGDGGGKREA